MTRIQNISRRDFLKQTGATGALVLGAADRPGLDGRGRPGPGHRQCPSSPTCSSPSPTTAW